MSYFKKLVKETAAKKTVSPLEGSVAAAFDGAKDKTKLIKAMEQWFGDDLDDEANEDFRKIKNGKQFAKLLMECDPVMAEGGIIDFIQKFKLAPTSEIKAFTDKLVGKG